jgi:membrane protease YdiL (CAAX protease family)
MGWISDAVVPALIASFVIYALIRPKGFLFLPDRHTNWTALVRVGAIWLFAWLIGCSIAAIRAGHWIRFTYSTHNAAEMVGFTLIGPLAEELLFRGALFELAERAFPVNPKAVALSTSTVFMLFHLQFHDFKVTPSAIGQMAFTFPLGLALGALRSNSKSIWPGLVLHSLTNLPGIFGS